MNSTQYWKLRHLQRMDEYHKDADQVIGKILEAYQDAIEELNSQMRKILNTYSATSKITTEEALQNLTTSQSKSYLDNLRKTIDTIQDEDLKAEMLRQINAPAYRARLTRLQALKEQLNIECQKIADIQVREIEQGLINTANTAYYKTIFDIQQQTGIGYSFAKVPTNQIQEILKNNWSGEHFSKRVWGNMEKLSSELQHSLTKGFMTGASIKKMSDEISARMEVGKYEATRLVRTETTYVANSAELASYKESGIEKLQYLATLDTRTSDICRKHDGKIILVKDAMPGVNIPPLHANCRSTTIEVFEDDNIAELERRARDPITGKNIKVPANMTYKQWYKENVTNNPRALINEKKIKNMASDKKQHEEYSKVLGNEVPIKFDDFQELKYNDIKKWEDLKGLFSYIIANPESNKTYYEINKKIEELRRDGKIRIKGIAVKPIAIQISKFNDHTLQRMEERGITREDAQSFIDDSIIAFKQRLGTQYAYYSEKGFTAISIDGVVASTGWLDEKGEVIIREVKKIL